MSLHIENKTHFRTDDLCRFIVAGLRAKGASLNKNISVAYSRRRGGCGGYAIVGRNGREAHWIQLTVPKTLIQVVRPAEYVRTPVRDPFNLNYNLLIDKSGCFEPSGWRLTDGVWEALRPAEERRVGVATIEGETLLDLARVLEHEIDHNLGLNHGDMLPVSSLRPKWHEGLVIRRQGEAQKPTRVQKSERREAHARAMLAKHEDALRREQRLVKRWTQKVRYYDRKKEKVDE